MSDRDRDVELLETEEGPRPSSGAEDQGDQEVEVLRSELGKLQAALQDAQAAHAAAHEKYLRARADLENYRRRAQQESERAREAGLDSALLPVLSVFDDLSRAIKMADEDDPSKLLPGLQAVLGGLERKLETLGVRRIGAVGEPFDPNLHEALTVVATDEPAKEGTIAELFEAGFAKGERLIRPARVVVYQ